MVLLSRAGGSAVANYMCHASSCFSSCFIFLAIFYITAFYIALMSCPRGGVDVDILPRRVCTVGDVGQGLSVWA